MEIEKNKSFFYLMNGNHILAIFAVVRATRAKTRDLGEQNCYSCVNMP